MAKVVAYCGGTYGSFVNWLVNYLSRLEIELTSPVTEKGDSHKWVSEITTDRLHIGYWDSWELSEEVNDEFIYQIHPCHHDNNKIVDHLRAITEYFDKVVYLYADESNLYWTLNNRIDKIFLPMKSWDQWLDPDYTPNSEDTLWKDFVFDNQQELLANWPKNQQGKLDFWAQREYLSFMLKDSTIDALGINRYNEIKQLNMLMVNINDLRDNFEKTVKEIMEYLNLLVERDDSVYEKIYNEWISKQKHIFKDKLINDIIDAVLSDNSFEWSDLTLADEAIIQCILREKGYELKCYGLNDFPTNSKQLRELIYAT